MAIQFDIQTKGADQLDSLNKSLSQGANSAQNIRGQLKALQKELSTLDVNSEKFNELSKQAGELKDKLNDASEAIKANAGNAFESLGNNASLLTQRIGSLDFEGATQSVKSLAGNLGNLKFKDLASGAKGFGSSMASLGKALITNPIFLIGTAIVALIANFDKLKNFIPGLAKAFEFIGDVIGSVADAITWFTDKIGLTSVAAQDALDEIVNGLDERLGELDRQKKRAVEIARKNGQDAAAVEKEYTDKIVAEYTKQLTALAQKVARGQELSDEELAAQKKAREALFNLQTEQLKQQNDKEDAVRKEAQAKADEAAKLAEQKRKERAAEAAKQREKEAEERKKKLQEEYEYNKRVSELNAKIQSDLDAERKRQSEAQKASDAEEKARLEEKKAAELEVINALAEARYTDQEAEIAAIDAKYIELRKKAMGNAELQKQIAEEAAKEIAAVEEKYAKASFEARLNLAGTLIDGLQSLNDIFQGKSEKSAKRAFAVSKALGLAQAGMDTYKSVNAVLSDPTLIGPARWIAAGAALTAGLANVAKIARTKFEPSGNSSSAPSGGSGGNIQPNISTPAQQNTPNFNTLNTAFLNNRPTQQPAVAAYVLSGQVANQLEADTKIKDRTRL